MTPPAGSPLVLGEAPGPLRPTDSFQSAARAAMWPQVRRMVELEPAVRQSDAGEDLKRYRVATRRLRAALRVFEDALPQRALRDVAPELAELARAVGRARDLDVRIANLPDGDGLQPLLDAWMADRAVAARDVVRRLDTKRHARLLTGLARLVSGDSGGHAVRGTRTVRDRAGSAVWSEFERLRSTATDLDGAEVEALHDLRIRAKRLRYTIEFLAPVLGSDREWLIARLVEMQDHLGALNDADIAATAARATVDALGSELPDAERQGIEAYIAAQALVVERLRRATPRTAAPIVAAGFARRLSKAILGPVDEPEPGRAARTAPGAV